MRSAVRKALKNVTEGGGFAAALEDAGCFPPMLVHLAASGEASGRLPAMLERAADAQRRELETTVAALTAVLEPALILVMGGMVLFIVLAILSPIVQMNQLVR